MSAISLQPAPPIQAASRSSNLLTQSLALLVSLAGLLVMLAWGNHWTMLIQPGPGTATMKFNASCCFVLCGVATALLPGHRSWLIRWCGSIVLAVGAMALSEYLLPIRWGIDTLFVNEYLPDRGAWPGRMSPLSASAFTLYGATLLLSQTRLSPSRKALVVGLSVTVLSIGTTVVLAGYLFGIDAAYGWGADTRMAWHSAVLFLALAVSVFVWIWRVHPSQRSQLMRWVPATSSLALVAMVGIISIANVTELHQATEWRKRSYQTVVAANTLLSELGDAERGMLSYTLQGQTEARARFEQGAADADQSLTALLSLNDDPAQQPRLVAAAADIRRLQTYCKSLIAARDAGGRTAVDSVLQSGDGPDVGARARAEIQAVIDAESRQLMEHDESAQGRYDDSFQLLIGSAVMAAILLLSAHVIAHVEVRRRRRVQSELNASVEALQVSEARQTDLAKKYRSLYERTPAMVHSIDEDTRLLSVSDTWLRKMGYAREEVIGRRFEEFIAPECLQRVKDNSTQRFFRRGGGEGLEYQLRCKGGATIDVLVSAIVQSDDDGVGSHALAVLEDVTLRNRAWRELAESRALLDRAGRIAGIGGWSIDLKTGVIVWSEEVCRIHELPLDYRPVFDSALKHYPEEAAKRILDAVDRCARDGVSYDLELPFVTARGRQGWVRAAGEAFREGDAITRIFGVFQDITVRKRAEQAVADQHHLMRVTLDSIGDAVITTNTSGSVDWLNPAAARLTGWSAEDARGQPVDRVFRVVHEETRQALPGPVDWALMGAPTIAATDNAVLLSRDELQHAVETSAAPIRDSQGVVLGVVLVFHDVSEERRRSREIGHRASHDALTGLVNRHEFETRLARLFAACRNERRAHVLMFIDLDHFKAVNDACGHAAGDQVLRDVTQIIRRIVRSRDTLARLGGDEFAVLMEECTVPQAHRVAARICVEVADYRYQHRRRAFQVSTSIGLAPLDARWQTQADAMQAADSACYAAKEGGRNCVREWVEPDKGLAVQHL